MKKHVRTKWVAQGVKVLRSMNVMWQDKIRNGYIIKVMVRNEHIIKRVEGTLIEDKMWRSGPDD